LIREFGAEVKWQLINEWSIGRQAGGWGRASRSTPSAHLPAKRVVFKVSTDLPSDGTCNGLYLKMVPDVAYMVCRGVVDFSVPSRIVGRRRRATHGRRSLLIEEVGK
jgi:hypothetical protein